MSETVSRKPGPQVAPEGAQCSECGRATERTDGVCHACWYRSDDRPKPVRDRYAKLERLVELGIAPYAYDFDRSHTLAEAGALPADEGEGASVRVAGRILSLRDLGGSAFAHLGDRSGRLQVYFKRDELDERDRELTELLDLGDWIGVSGTMFRTRAGEITVRVADLDLLSKTLRPLPFGKEEILPDGERVVHSGFSDLESRYRQRYADLAVNPDVREVFMTRAALTRALRAFLDSRGFVEVETPILQPLYGGALAEPFTTHHKTLDSTLYLRIADELYLKRLIVGGLERVYEIGKDFRNEGMDRTHHPEFTMLEFYQAFADYGEVMGLAEAMITFAFSEVLDSLTVRYEGQEISFETPWERLPYLEALERYAKVDASAAELEELRREARAEGRDDAGELSRGKLIDVLFGARVEPELVQPTIVYDLPIEVSPLAKPKLGDARLAERFEVFAGGMEIMNAFSELNDPLDQWDRFADQARQREEGDAEAHGLDEDYIRALEYGLPPTGGLGLGFDRLVMLATGRETIREVILFPILRPTE